MPALAVNWLKKHAAPPGGDEMVGDIRQVAA